MDKPWRTLPDEAQKVILFGTGEEKIKFSYDDGARRYDVAKAFEGVLPNMERRWRETDSAWVREELGRYQSETPCETCHGFRLKPEALAVRVGAKHIAEVSNLSIKAAHAWFAALENELTPKQMEIARRDPEGDLRPAALPERRGPGLPEPVAQLRQPVGRREPGAFAWPPRSARA